jgi:signal peptidase I
MLKIFKIKGCSLSPILEEGDYVLVLNKFFKLKENDIVIFRHPEHGILIKRIKKILQDKIFVEGTDLNSLDSRTFGAVDLNYVIGKVIFKIRK